MFVTAIGHSNDIVRPKFAIRAAIDDCKKTLSNYSFSSEDVRGGLLWLSKIDRTYMELILNIIKKEFPNISLIGCTTDGEIGYLENINENSIVLVVFATPDDSLKFIAGCKSGLRDKPDEVVDKVCESIKSKMDEKDFSENNVCFTFPNGLASFDFPVVSKLQKSFEYPIFGGLSGDSFIFEQAFEFCIDDSGCRVMSDSVPVLIMISPELKYSFGVESGWQPIDIFNLDKENRFTEENRVTEAKGNTVFEIGGKKAWEFYEKYFGKIDSKNLKKNKNITSVFSEFPIAVHLPSETIEEAYLRTPSKFNIKDKSIRFAGEVPKDTFVEITRIPRANIIDAAKTSFDIAKKRFPPESHVELTLFFDCCSRRRILGTEARHEFDFLRKYNDLKYAGFYGYGEIAPLKIEKGSLHLDSTIVTVMLGR